MNEHLHKENGKLYVLLCGCNSMEKTNMPYSYSVGIFGLDRIGFSNEQCKVCKYFPKWYIKEVKDEG